MSQVSNQIMRRMSNAARVVTKRSATAAGTMFSHVSMVVVSAITIATNVTLTTITSLVAAFHLLNAKRVIPDTNRNANMALREIVMTSATEPIAIATQTTRRILMPRNRPRTDRSKRNVMMQARNAPALCGS